MFRLYVYIEKILLLWLFWSYGDLSRSNGRVNYEGVCLEFYVRTQNHIF